MPVVYTRLDALVSNQQYYKISLITHTNTNAVLFGRKGDIDKVVQRTKAVGSDVRVTVLQLVNDVLSTEI